MIKKVVCIIPKFVINKLDASVSTATADMDVPVGYLEGVQAGLAIAKNMIQTNSNLMDIETGEIYDWPEDEIGKDYEYDPDMEIETRH